MAIRVRKGYIIAGTPRTGSNLLCHWLRSCGAGNPREYINRHQLDKWYGRMEVQNPPFCLALKVFWGHLTNTRETPALYMRHVWERMGGDAVRWVYLTREDRLRQALSLARVRVTGKWTHKVEQGEVQPVVIPFDRIQLDKDMQLITEQNGYWQQFFIQHDIIPMRVTYEQLCADMPAVVRAVLAHIQLGVYRDVDVPLQKQAGVDVELLARRYYATNKTPVLSIGKG